MDESSLATNIAETIENSNVDDVHSIAVNAGVGGEDVTDSKAASEDVSDRSASNDSDAASEDAINSLASYNSKATSEDAIDRSASNDSDAPSGDVVTSSASYNSKATSEDVIDRSASNDRDDPSGDVVTSSASNIASFSDPTSQGSFPEDFENRSTSEVSEISGHFLEDKSMDDLNVAEADTEAAIDLEEIISGAEVTG